MSILRRWHQPAQRPQITVSAVAQSDKALDRELERERCPAPCGTTAVAVLAIGTMNREQRGIISSSELPSRRCRCRQTNS
jgi:hypothetical protein